MPWRRTWPTWLSQSELCAQHRLFSNVWKAYVDTQEEFSSVAKFCCLLIATLWSLSSYTHSVKSQKRTQIGTDDTKKNGVSFHRQFFCLFIATLWSLSSYTHNVEEPEKNQSKPEWSTTTDIHIHMRQYEVCFFYICTTDRLSGWLGVPDFERVVYLKQPATPRKDTIAWIKSHYDTQSRSTFLQIQTAPRPASDSVTTKIKER